MTVVKWGLGLLACGMGAACTATNTGNPVDGTVNGPEGIALVRSSLERDTTPEISDTDFQAFGASGRDFAFDLYAEASSADGNLAFSPHSIRVALGMTYAGALGTTKDEMATVMHFDLPESELHAAFNRSALELESRAKTPLFDFQGNMIPSGIAVDVINAAFTDQGYDFKRPFLDTLAQQYGTGMYAADFMSQPEQERMAINAWVEEKTRDRVQDLLPDGSIDQGTAFVLVNALYFKAPWLFQFAESDTADAVFHAPAGDVTVPTMTQYRKGEYAEGDGYQAMYMPYQGFDMGMVLILPEEGRFTDIEGRLDGDFFDTIWSDFNTYSLDIALPRFEVTSTLPLDQQLKSLGLDALLSPGTCDISGIAGAPRELYITGIFHKAFVAIDEEGTEAAAATASVGGSVSAPPPATFHADRPFIFAIYDEPTREILFLGRVTDPS